MVRDTRRLPHAVFLAESLRHRFCLIPPGDVGHASPKISEGIALGAARGFEASKEHEKLYRATLQAVVDGLIIGRGRHGVVLALSNDKADPRFSLAVKVIHKEFTT